MSHFEKFNGSGSYSRCDNYRKRALLGASFWFEIKFQFGYMKQWWCSVTRMCLTNFFSYEGWVPPQQHLARLGKKQKLNLLKLPLVSEILHDFFLLEPPHITQFLDSCLKIFSLFFSTNYLSHNKQKVDQITGVKDMFCAVG